MRHKTLILRCHIFTHYGSHSWSLSNAFTIKREMASSVSWVKNLRRSMMATDFKACSWFLDFPWSMK